ncbi:hypothetical protein [Streptomyces arboris]|uniref:Uncharacterized protein n=1 Tax=Streptomyces arboris TaxID=2600619 RepID=A0A5N5EC18_9ACTN|nr:hypothetical protein [Streptomyces arboris]KAB2588035.1 hypothetical protein F5983_34630 [Streptomyces arboris]
MSSTTVARQCSGTTPASGTLSAASKNAPSFSGWSRYRWSRSMASITGRLEVLLHFSSSAPSSGDSIRRQCAEYDDRSTVRTRAL